MRLKSPYLRSLSFATAAVLTLLGCGDSTQGNRSIDDIPDAQLTAALLGNWRLSTALDRTDCPQDSESDGDKFAGMVLRIEESSCKTDMDTLAYRKEGGIQCKAGGDQIGTELDEHLVLWGPTEADASCSVHVTGTVLMRHDPATDTLQGDFNGVINLEGSCPQSIRADFPSCSGSGRVEGVRWQVFTTGSNSDPDQDRTSDRDRDRVPDFADNCPDQYNIGQTDIDGNGVGNACEADDDGDRIQNSLDPCPNHYGNRSDQDDDGLGDQCDNCVLEANPSQENMDSDRFGDACDPDRDGDRVNNESDNCPNVSNSDQLDRDGNGVGDRCQRIPIPRQPGLPNEIPAYLPFN